MTNTDHWRAIACSYISTLPSGHVFRSRDLFTWVESTVTLLPTDCLPVQRPRWRTYLSRALQRLSHQGVIMSANELPRSRVWVVQ